MGRTCAEASGVGTGSIDQSCDLSLGLGEVAAAALVHVAAGLFAAVDYVLDFGSVDAGFAEHMEDSEDAGSLGYQVLEHNVSGEVGVYVVSSLDITDQLAFVRDGLCMLFIDEVHDVVLIDAVLDHGHDVLGDDGVSSQLCLVSRYEVLVQTDQVECVAYLHEQDELGLGHDLAELAVSGALNGLALFIPGLAESGQVLDGHVADVGLVGSIVDYLLVGSHVRSDLLEVIGIGVYDLFSGLSSAVIHDHAGDVDEDITGASDYAVAHYYNNSFR